MKILLIEDERTISEPLKTNLESEGFTIDVANDGEQGSFLARTNDYNLILLDYILPKKNGREVCEEIRKDGVKAPVIMLTVKSEVENIVDLLNLGADDYLAKPFSFTELLARINAILRRPNELQGDILKLDNLVIDTKKQTVKRGEREVYLTRKEFQLLEHLVRNKGNVLTRGIIMENVWDMNADPFSNTIESHILNIRKKVDLNEKTKLIYTVPGRGYKADIVS